MEGTASKWSGDGAKTAQVDSQETTLEGTPSIARTEGDDSDDHSREVSAEDILRVLETRRRSRACGHDQSGAPTGQGAQVDIGRRRIRGKRSVTVLNVEATRDAAHGEETLQLNGRCVRSKSSTCIGGDGFCVSSNESTREQRQPQPQQPQVQQPHVANVRDDVSLFSVLSVGSEMPIQSDGCCRRPRHLLEETPREAGNVSRPRRSRVSSISSVVRLSTGDSVQELSSADESVRGPGGEVVRVSSGEESCSLIRRAEEGRRRGRHLMRQVRPGVLEPVLVGVQRGVAWERDIEESKKRAAKVLEERQQQVERMRMFAEDRGRRDRRLLP